MNRTMRKANIDLRMQRDEFTDEYRVAVLIDGRFQEGPTYYTDDFEDCKGTRNMLRSSYEGHGHTVDTKDTVHRIDFEAWGKRYGAI